MAHPYHHSVSSARKFGGKPEDYQKIHDWFDDTKATFADFRHRALKHHSLGIFWCEKEFGVTITNSDGKEVPVRLVAEQHVREDCGYVPSVQDWLQHLKPEKWMGRPPIKLERELELTEGEVTV
jgi:hypothetical protein